ncbi:hypothetical protein [Devosia rhizoryzae]|uniref:Uncharacterized protein n=1 Tax=Devosia rhizoryzae TaxID=2774137 RepID=A0ABX7C8V4_9HYPH|nr:hypothetical protein [Devosia rhizoryzae]QQR40698.1 hypothetical protein JI748_06800 [Devosia rhizoryzae]
MLPTSLNKLLLAASAARVFAMPAMALDTVSCADSDGEMTFTYVTGPALVQPVLSVDMQLTGDFGFSTKPDDPKYDGEYVYDGFIGREVEGGDVAWDDEDGDRHHAMSFRIGRTSHGAHSIIGGVVSVEGGGLWVVECRSTYVDE